MALPMTKPFGDVITAGVVSNSLRETLVEFLPPLLEVLAVRAGFGPGELLAPIGYGAGDGAEQVRDQPMGIVVCPGISGRPVKHADGLYEMPWDVAAAIVACGRSSDEAKAMSEVYGAALRACVLQHPSLKGLASSTQWIDERYEQIAYSTDASVWACTIVFRVSVDAAVDGYATAGPNPVIQSRIITIGIKQD